MTEQQRAIDAQITELLHKAAERPGPNDPLGLVGMLATLAPAKMCSIRTFECTHPGGCTRSDCEANGSCAD